MKIAIKPDNAPKAIGPYSPAVLVNNTLYISGQLGIDPTTGELAKTIEEQTRLSLNNIRTILLEAGMSTDHIVKTTVLLSDINNFGAMNNIYNEYFNEPYPARAAFEVAALPKGGLVEIEAIAVKE